MNPRSPRIVLATVVGIVGVFGAGYAARSLTSSTPASAVAPTNTNPTNPVASTSHANTLTQIYAKDAPGVVTITVAGRENSNDGIPFGPQRFEAIGTGFEIDLKGNIMTAEHVISGAKTIKVTFQDGSTANATLVGSDSSTDSAVIHVDVPASNLHPLTIGDSSSVLPGQAVVAIGTPLSTSYAGSMSAGIVSAINRTITAPNGFSIPGSIQTDAAINHGNSGGPLIDVATNTVIGINDQIAVGTVDANVGIGFAVPINSASTSATTLIDGGTVQHAYMGVRIGTPTGGGAKIGLIVANSPAAKAGLKKHDVITAYNGKAVASADALTAYVTQSRVGEKVKLTIRRGGTTKHITLTLGNQPAAAK